MRTIILADRLGHELFPLTDRTCTALLPVAGKSILEHNLDMLANAGIKRVVVVIGSFADQIRTYFEYGQRWGMEFEYWGTRGEEEPQAVLAQLPKGPDYDQLLIIRGDMLRTPCVAEFLQRAATCEGPVLHGVFHGQALGISLCRAGQADLSPLHWPALMQGLPVAAETFIELAEAKAYRLESLAAYHQANLDAAAGRIPGLLIPGRQTALGLTQGRNSKVSSRCLKLGVAFVGSGSEVHPTAELSHEVVISDQVIVDRYAKLSDTVILPNTYVGELVNLSKSIAWGNVLIRVDIDTHVRITDAFLLADLRQTTLGNSLSPLLNRLGGLLLLLLSLPLWPLAALAANHEKTSGKLFRSRQLRGNRINLTEFGERHRAEFTAWEWSTTRPLFRALPRILALLSGDLRLVGVEPVTSEQALQRTEEWERCADGAPAGLIGPAQLRYTDKTPEEERLLADAYYVGQHDRWKNWLYLWEGILTLFSRRPWSREV
ncbi:MAG: NDP-sugar synthase [Proteobacteria bacterium]|nr:NDP-sugar synthase [Pseudomonadota bacterium]